MHPATLVLESPAPRFYLVETTVSLHRRRHPAYLGTCGPHRPVAEGSQPNESSPSFERVSCKKVRSRYRSGRDLKRRVSASALCRATPYPRRKNSCPPISGILFPACCLGCFQFQQGA